MDCAKMGRINIVLEKEVEDLLRAKNRKRRHLEDGERGVEEIFQRGNPQN